jgi:hypothetical protein
MANTNAVRDDEIRDDEVGIDDIRVLVAEINKFSVIDTEILRDACRALLRVLSKRARHFHKPSNRRPATRV